MCQGERWTGGVSIPGDLQAEVVPCGHVGPHGKWGCWREPLWPGRPQEPGTKHGGLGEGREAGGREAFRLSGNVNFTPGYFLWDLFLGELETLPNYVWVSFKAHKLHPVLLPSS